MDGSVARKRSALTSRAALAAHAYIRHHHTDYHDRLDNANVGIGGDIDDDDYREINAPLTTTSKHSSTLTADTSPEAAARSDDLRVDTEVVN